MQTTFSSSPVEKKILLAAVIGNMMEWYDFSLYGYFAPVLSVLFFPSHSKVLSLLAVFGVFAVGYLMRALGSMIAGYYGDRLGRKKMLSITVIAMAVITTLIGLLPTYQSIGIFAGIALILCRLLQGIAVGGEYSGSVVYLIERASLMQRGLYGSFALFSCYFGLLLGSALAALTSKFLGETTLYDWGWRIPFLLGSVLGLLGLYLRKLMPETEQFCLIQKNKTNFKKPYCCYFHAAI